MSFVEVDVFLLKIKIPVSKGDTIKSVVQTTMKKYNVQDKKNIGVKMNNNQIHPLKDTNQYNSKIPEKYIKNGGSNNFGTFGNNNSGGGFGGFNGGGGGFGGGKQPTFNIGTNKNTGIF